MQSELLPQNTHRHSDEAAPRGADFCSKGGLAAPARTGEHHVESKRGVTPLHCWTHQHWSAADWLLRPRGPGDRAQGWAWPWPQAPTGGVSEPQKSIPSGWPQQWPVNEGPGEGGEVCTWGSGQWGRQQPWPEPPKSQIWKLSPGPLWAALGPGPCTRGLTSGLGGQMSWILLQGSRPGTARHEQVQQEPWAATEGEGTRC